jgi:hypothetical protein
MQSFKYIVDINLKNTNLCDLCLQAQVGVGISGKEGQQAVNNSDFAVAQFRLILIVIFSVLHIYM